MTLVWNDVARVIEAREPANFPGCRIPGWSIDSRTIAVGDLFFALRGPQHDGHAYVRNVIERGAAGAVVEEGSPSGALLIVEDTLAALQKLAAWARSHWGGQVVAVTGSAGKTTTKDVIAHLLSAEMPAGKTIGNLNNHVGVPLSILRLPDECRVAVLEMGMNHAGEIRALARIARPDVGVVTNVGYAHVEAFGSIEAVALAKRELIEELPAAGVAVLNADDRLVAQFREIHRGRVMTFGFSEGAVSIAGTLSFYQAAGDSGKSVSRGFCPKCGSPLLWKFAALPGLVLITAGSLDDPSMFKPQAVLYTSAGHAWDHVDPELPKFEKLWPRD